MIKRFWKVIFVYVRYYTRIVNRNLFVMKKKFYFLNIFWMNILFICSDLKVEREFTSKLSNENFDKFIKPPFRTSNFLTFFAKRVEKNVRNTHTKSGGVWCGRMIIENDYWKIWENMMMIWKSDWKREYKMMTNFLFIGYFFCFIKMTKLWLNLF